MDSVMLRGARIWLRSPTPDDAFNVYEWENDDDVWKYDIHRSHELDFGTFLVAFDRECEHWLDTQRQRRFIIEDEERIPIGFVGYFNLTLIDHLAVEQQVEIGIGLGYKERQGKGYGSDAIRTLTAHLFLQSNIVRVYAQTVPDNHFARHAFANAGFVEVGLIRDQWIELERWKPSLLEENNEYS